MRPFRGCERPRAAGPESLSVRIARTGDCLQKRPAPWNAPGYPAFRIYRRTNGKPQSDKNGKRLGGGGNVAAPEDERASARAGRWKSQLPTVLRCKRSVPVRPEPVRVRLAQPDLHVGMCAQAPHLRHHQPRSRHSGSGRIIFARFIQSFRWDTGAAGTACTHAGFPCPPPVGDALGTVGLIAMANRRFGHEMPDAGLLYT